MANSNQIMNKLRGNPPIFFGGFLIIVLAAGAFLFFEYRRAAAQPSLESLAAQVSISQPANGAELTAYEPLAVNAMAIGPTPFLSLELWMDGELVSVQAGPSAGKTPLFASFAWLPKEEGNYSLVARAVDENGQTSTSPAILVSVIPNADVIDESAAALGDIPAVLPAVGGGAYSPPAGPGAGDTIDSGDDWQGSPGDWVNSFTNDDPPAAPELVIEYQPGTCTANLLIHDLSDSEAGFAVFRQLNGSDWLQTNTLAAHSQTGWIGLSDKKLVGGQNGFYVTAFNSQGEAQSNLVQVEVNPADCVVELADPNNPPEILGIKVQGISLLNTASPDKLYCYRSVNGGSFTKWPTSDYFYPDQEGNFVLDEILQIVVSDFEGPFEITGYLLQMECWGWYGTDLQFLGSLKYNDGAPTLGEATAIGGNLKADLVFEQLDGHTPGFGFGEVSAELAADINDIAFKYIFPPDMVPPAAKVTYDPEECTSHLMPDAQNLLGTILFCFPYPGFHGGFAEGNNPQPYLVWNFFKYCNLGYGTEKEGGPCHSYDYWLQYAADNNGKVSFYVNDYSSEGHQQWKVSAPQLTMLNIPPNGCNGTRTFSVQMVYEQDSLQQYSPVSNPFTINCPKPVGNVVTLDFTFENMSLNNQDDGDSGTQTVELFGYFQVQAPSSQLGNNNFLKMGAWDEQWSDCPDDTDAFVSNPPGSCTQRFTNGSHNLFNVPLCKSSDYTEDSEYHCYMHFGNSAVQDSYHAPNNTLRVEVQDGDSIKLWVILHDWDDASANDLTCWGYSDLGSKSIFEWDAIDGAGFSIVAFGDVNSGGSCSISGTIHVVE